MKDKSIIKNIFNKEVLHINIINNENKYAISNEVANKKPSIYEYNVEFADHSTLSFMGKHKSRKIIVNGINLLSNHDVKLLISLIKNNKILGYSNSCLREITIYNNIDNSLRENVLRLYGYYIEKLRDKYFVAIEKCNTNYDITMFLIKNIIKAITNFHAFYYNNEKCIKSLLLNSYTPKDYKKCKRVIRLMFDNLEKDNINLFSEKQINTIYKFIDTIDIEYEKFMWHKTLTHNDFALRNILIDGDDINFIDWELACFQNPEHDFVEFLIDVMDKLNNNEIDELLSFYKTTFYEKIKVNITEKEYNDLIRFNSLEYCINKLSMLRLANKKLHKNFIRQLELNTKRLLDILKI